MAAVEEHFLDPSRRPRVHFTPDFSNMSSYGGPHADGTLKAQASPIGMILIVILLLGRRALSAFLEPHAAAWGLNATAVADAFLVFVVGTIIVQRVEMYIRARRVQHGGTDSHVEATA